MSTLVLNLALYVRCATALCRYELSSWKCIRQPLSKTRTGNHKDSESLNEADYNCRTVACKNYTKYIHKRYYWHRFGTKIHYKLAKYVPFLNKRVLGVRQHATDRGERIVAGRLDKLVAAEPAPASVAHGLAQPVVGSLAHFASGLASGLVGGIWW